MPQVTGIIARIESEEIVNEKITKRRFLVEEGDKHKNTVSFTLLNDRTDLTSPYNEGDQVKVSFDIRCREHHNKWYTELNAWRIERV